MTDEHDDKRRGIYEKYIVKRADGKHRPGREYFVLDLDSDPFAKAAMLAYAQACEASHPVLAADIRDRYAPQEGGNA